MKLSGVSKSVKKNGAAAVLSAPVKSAIQIDVCSGDENSIKPADGAATHTVPVNPIVQTGNSSSEIESMEPTDGTVTSSGPVKLAVETGDSSDVRIGARGKASVSAADKGKAVVTDNDLGKGVTFKDVTLGPHEAVLRFRLIHFWEAWNIQSKTLIGFEMFLINEEETVIQGYIPRGRIDLFLPHLKAGSLYQLNNFFGSSSKPIYGVAEPGVTISFSWNSVLSLLEEGSVRNLEDRFRVHGYKEFEAACDLKGDLFDYIGHIKFVNGQVPSESLLLDKAEADLIY